MKRKGRFGFLFCDEEMSKPTKKLKPKIKAEIDKAVKKLVKQYGEVLKRLGKE
jgi:hypothetical protein